MIDMILTNAEIDYAEEQQAFDTLVAHARAANDRMEKDLDIIKRQTAEIERLKTKPLWAELEDALREIEADALAASPEAAPRLPGAVLQANEDGTISKVEPQPDEELATNAYLMGRNSKTREAEARGMEMLLEWQLKKQAKYGGQSVDFIAAHRAAGEGE